MILGETAGGLRYNMGLGTKTFVLPSTQPKDGVIGPSNRSCEHGSYIIESLETGRPFRGHFNVMNNGCISNLPDDSCIEAPGYVDGNGVNIPRVGPLPLGCAAICNASISVQRLSVEAAVHGDVDLLKQAALMDPLTAAVCDPNEISQLVDQLLVSEAKWLPQYKSEIPKARRRLAKEKPLGTHSISRLKWLKDARPPGLHRTRQKK
jgi:alpha-galactosidase